MLNGLPERIHKTVYKHLRGMHDQRRHGLRGDRFTALAHEVYNKAAQKDKEITPIITGIARNTGGEMAGLNSRLKTVESTARKIKKWVVEDDMNAREVASMQYDALRYTAVFPNSKTFVSKTQDFIREMGARGFRLEAGTKFFGNGAYRGYNTRFVDKKGYIFEVQFHTRESYNLKHQVHAMYEKFRTLPPKSPAANNLFSKMAAKYNDFENPVGWEQLEGYTA